MEKTLKEMRLWSKVTLLHKVAPHAMFSDAELEENWGRAKNWTEIIFGAVCSGSRWLQYKIAAVGGLHLLDSSQAFIKGLIWAHYWFWEEMNLVINFKHLIAILR